MARYATRAAMREQQEADARAAQQERMQQEGAHDDDSNAPHKAALAAASVHAVRRRRGAGGATPDRQRRQAQQDSARRGGASPQGTELLSFEALPDYLQDNEFIKTGYRYDLPMKDTLRSLFNLHNETGNVWSHLIGFIIFLVLTVWMVNKPPTPLLLAKPHVDELWGSVQQHLLALRARGMELVPGQLQQALSDLVVHPLHDSWQSGVHSLQSGVHSLQESVQGGVSSLQESVHSLQESVQESVHSLQESVHSLQESVHHLQDRVQVGAQQLAEHLQHRLLALLHEGRVAAGDAVTHLHLPPALLAALAPGLQWPTARWPMYVFCTGAMSCLLLSAFCHLFGCCKQHISQFIWRLDYTGISLLIVSSFYPTVYYSFLCRPSQAAVYLVSITVLGAATVVMSLMERFQRSEWRSTRAGLYVCLGLCGVVPLVHIMALHGDVWHVRNFVAADALMGFCYLTGAFIYAMRVPERWFPGKFDFLLHSHQIFHVFVVLGAYLHWRAALLLLEWRDASGGCAMPITQGPLRSVLADMRAQGHELLAIEQVWDSLRAALLEHVHHLLSGGQGSLADGAAAPGALPAAGAAGSSPVDGLAWLNGTATAAAGVPTA